jgi:hypothetical protein
VIRPRTTQPLAHIESPMSGHGSVPGRHRSSTRR